MTVNYIFMWVHDTFSEEVKAKHRKKQMAEKAEELLSDYSSDRELTAFTEIDGEDFL